jgi:hypothetical protein
LGVICFLKRKRNLWTNFKKKNNNLRKNCWNTTYHKTFKLDYPQVVAPLPDSPHFACEFLQKASLILDRIQKSQTTKIKLLLVKHIHIKQQFKKIYVIKHNLTICFSCETNRMDSLVYFVIEPLISMFQFFMLDCNYRTKHLNISY